MGIDSIHLILPLSALALPLFLKYSSGETTDLSAVAGGCLCFETLKRSEPGNFETLIINDTVKLLLLPSL